MNVNLKQLRAFVEIYRTGKLKTAAERLCVTESAVSLLLKRMEESVGVPLFARTTRSLEPTEAAREAIEIAEHVLASADVLDASFRGLSEKKRGLVRIATTPAFASNFVPVVMKRFQESYPGVRVILEDCAPDQILPKVVGGLVDFGLGSFSADDDDVTVDVLKRDYLSVVCRKDSPLARKQTVRWSELDTYPLIASKQNSGGSRGLIDQAAAEAGRNFAPAYETSFMATSLQMVAVGLGVAIMPSLLVTQADSKEIVARKLVAPVVNRSVGIVRRRRYPMTPAAEAFAALLKAELAQHPGQDQPRRSGTKT